MAKQDLTQYSDDELSLLVMNDQALYSIRHKRHLTDTLDALFDYTSEQMEVLTADLDSDFQEMMGF